MMDAKKKADPFYYENLFRPIYEHKMAAGWWTGALLNTVLTQSYTLSGITFATTIGLSAVGLFRYLQGVPLAKKQAQLNENALVFYNAFDIFSQQEKTKIYLGDGFVWGQEHAQRSKQILALSSGKEEITIPTAYKPFTSKAQQDVSQNLGGLPWIHGIGHPEPIIKDNEIFVGNTVVFGSTRQGKTRYLEVVATYNVHQPNRSVIIIDPKGDDQLIARLKKEHDRIGKPNDLYIFHPSRPSESCRIDPLANYSRTTEIASRISSLLATDGDGSDTFVAFAWKTVNSIAQAMDYCGKKPNLIGLKRYIDTVESTAELLKLTIVNYFKQSLGEHWIEKMKPLFKAEGEDLEILDTVKPISMYDLYRIGNQKSVLKHSAIVDELASTVMHDREHFSKMILNLAPVLSKLCSAPLDELLSPDVADQDPNRPIVNIADIIAEGKTLYIALDALTDQDISSAIGSILIADLTACAGFKYNHEGKLSDELKETGSGQGRYQRKINLYVDEASEVVNKRLVAMLNKSAGAGFETTILTQTFPDFVAKTGSEAMARQILGNCNNMISFKVTDSDTINYVTESFGETTIKQTMQTMATNTSSGDELSSWSGGYGERLIEADGHLFSPTLLSNLPKLQYIARFSDGTIMKGRIPILTN